MEEVSARSLMACGRTTRAYHVLCLPTRTTLSLTVEWGQHGATHWLVRGDINQSCHTEHPFVATVCWHPHKTLLARGASIVRRARLGARSVCAPDGTARAVCCHTHTHTHYLSITHTRARPQGAARRQWCGASRPLLLTHARAAPDATAWPASVARWSAARALLPCPLNGVHCAHRQMAPLRRIRHASTHRDGCGDKRPGLAHA